MRNRRPPRRHAKLPTLPEVYHANPDDPRLARYRRLWANWNRRHSVKTDAQEQRALNAIAKKLGVVPHIVGTIAWVMWGPIRMLSPVYPTLRPDMSEGESMRLLRQLKQAVAKGRPIPWRQTNAAGDEEQIIMQPLHDPSLMLPTRRRRATGNKTGHPLHPFTSEILEDIRHHPEISNLARSKELTKRYTQSAASRGAKAPKVSVSLVRKLALQVRDSPP